MDDTAVIWELCFWVSKIKDYMTYGAEHLHVAIPAWGPALL